MLRLTGLLMILSCVACTRLPPAPADGGSGCSCSGRECGTDGCGNSCGTCTGGSSCTASGQCASACIPDCRGRDCGPDPVCGTSCGSTSCDDGNVCTADSCSAGSCTHTNVDSVLGCVDDLTISVCAGGSYTEHSCGRLAREQSGNNATYGCSDDICMSTDYADRPTCTYDENDCATSSTGGALLGKCLRDDTGQTYWYFRTCTKVCLDEGWDSATGECGAGTDGRDVCFCR